MKVMNLWDVLVSSAILIGLIIPGNISAQNKRADGYRGIWAVSLKSPQYGYRYSGGMATSSPYHTPMAIYSDKVKKTFFVYGGTRTAQENNLQIMVSYFDHRTGMVPRPVIVYDKMGVRDPQDNPTISIDSQGFIYVFVSGMGRTRPGLIFKSINPFTIDEFEKIYEGELVFPQPWWIKDSCFVMMYTKFLRGRELFFSKSTDGKTWDPGTKVVSMGGGNQVTAATGTHLISAFNYFPDGSNEKQTNVYFIKSDDFGKTWTNVDNKVIDIPLTEPGNEALVKDYSAENKIALIKDVSFDSDHNPVILVITSMDFKPGPGGDPREWIVIHRKENKWILTKVCESFHNHDMGSLYIYGNLWRIIGSSEPGPQKYGTGGEMALWESNDGGMTWAKKSDITTGSLRNNSFARRPLHANRRFYSFWADGDPNDISESRLYFTDESCKKVWVLPYNMVQDFEKPARIK